MCWSQSDFLQIKLGDEHWDGVVNQKIHKHKYPTKHSFNERVENIAR